MRTFCLLKPDSFWRNTNFKILRALKEGGFTIIANRKIEKPTKEQVLAHFTDLKAKNLDAFNRNITYFLRGPVEALVLETKYEAVDKLRKLVGPTDPNVATAATIRGKFCVDTLALAEAQNRGLENSIHASDSEKSAKIEAQIWGLRI